ncbi:hypothetical protein RF11_01932 [Thelohanellus kitauei]|uniref:Sortilin N-terminal domain-containing protein n=1 Tax=Thelohanellus kitauei TaxID=669202 RepID=A0A0C2MIM1_THEKT|nr:hypothetical protein RF11_01932 [Thelohanellus kitauei]
MKFEGLDKHILRYEFWKGDQNYFVLNFKENDETSNTFNHKLFVSRDGGKSFIRWTPTYYGIPICVDHFIVIKNVLFGLSHINRTFFYVDRKFQIFSLQSLERDELVIPSEFDPSCVVKLVMQDVTLSSEKYYEKHSFYINAILSTIEPMPPDKI